MIEASSPWVYGLNCIRFQESHIIASGTQLISNPGFLQSQLDTQQDLDTGLKGLSTIVYSRETRPRMRCKCPCRYPTPASAAYIESKYALSHRNGCPLHESGSRTISFVMNRTICNRLLRFSVLASLQITAGAGGLAISPKLEFRPVVPEDSPAFTLLRGVEASFKSGFNRSVIQDTNKRLFELFREGKASPSDTLPNGETILHVSNNLNLSNCHYSYAAYFNLQRKTVFMDLIIVTN